MRQQAAAVHTLIALSYVWGMNSPGDHTTSTPAEQQHQQQPQASTQHGAPSSSSFGQHPQPDLPNVAPQHCPPTGNPPGGSLQNPPTPWLPPWVAAQGGPGSYSPVAATHFQWHATHPATNGAYVTSWGGYSLSPVTNPPPGNPTYAPQLGNPLPQAQAPPTLPMLPSGHQPGGPYQPQPQQHTGVSQAHPPQQPFARPQGSTI